VLQLANAVTTPDRVKDAQSTAYPKLAVTAYEKRRKGGLDIIRKSARKNGRHMTKKVCAVVFFASCPLTSYVL
jgi:hypothetical protein